MSNIQLNADLESDQSRESENPENIEIINSKNDIQDSPETSDEPQEEDSRFKDGEELTLVRVRFPGNAKSFPFLVGKRKFQYGQKVMAMSDRGMTVGYINSFPYKVSFNKTMLPLRSIARVAGDEDIRQQIEFHESEKRAEITCLHLIDKYALDMVLTHVEFIQFGKKAVFYFNAPQRVDFRDLVKDLVHELKMRIELRQISVRDRAAALGSVGACGLQTCCSSFLKNYGNVTIKMAKNQNLALIPSKLNGVCGQIKCCIKYEDEVYNDKRKNLPKEGSIIEALNGDKGKVLRLHLLIEQFEMLTDTGLKRRYASNQFSIQSLELPMDYRFPETFDNIIDETKTVIGLTVEEELVSKRFKELMDKDLNDSDDDDFEDSDDSEDEFDDEELDSENESATGPLPHYRENNSINDNREKQRQNFDRSRPNNHRPENRQRNDNNRNHPNRNNSNNRDNQNGNRDNQRPNHNRRFNNQSNRNQGPRGNHSGGNGSSNNQQ